MVASCAGIPEVLARFIAVNREWSTFVQKLQHHRYQSFSVITHPSLFSADDTNVHVQGARIEHIL
jgi:hypothetical protein